MLTLRFAQAQYVVLVFAISQNEKGIQCNSGAVPATVSGEFLPVTNHWIDWEGWYEYNVDPQARRPANVYFY